MDAGVVRLMAVSERAKQLFGEDGADAVADLIEHDPHSNYQQLLFPELEEERVPKVRTRGRRLSASRTRQAGTGALCRGELASILEPVPENATAGDCGPVYLSAVPGTAQARRRTLPLQTGPRSGLRRERALPGVALCWRPAV
jgi:hypothetical protein